MKSSKSFFFSISQSLFVSRFKTKKEHEKNGFEKKFPALFDWKNLWCVCVCVCCWGLQSAYLSSESEQIPVMCWQNGKHMTITPFSWPFHANQRYYRLVMCFNLLSSAFNMHILWFFFFFFFLRREEKKCNKKTPTEITRKNNQTDATVMELLSIGFKFFEWNNSFL